MRRTVWIILAALLVQPAVTFAHALLDHADPKVGSTVNSAPPSITLTFTEDVEPSFSRIELFDTSGKRIDTKLLEHPQGDMLRVALPPLGPGKYKVHWAVVSVDTHTTEGRFEFTVAPS